jgi:hypothetical protein
VLISGSWKNVHFADANQGCQMVYIFLYEKSQFGYFLEGLEKENVATYISFGIF